MYRLPASAMINLSHGHRKMQPDSSNQAKPTAVVKPQYGAPGSSPRQPQQRHLNQSNSARCNDEAGASAWNHNKPFEQRYLKGEGRSRQVKGTDGRTGQHSGDAQPKVLLSRSAVQAPVMAAGNRAQMQPQPLMSMPVASRMMYPPPPLPQQPLLQRHPMQVRSPLLNMMQFVKLD